MVNDSEAREGPWFPIEKEPKIPTLEKPLIIESACPGWQPGGSRFPAIPCSIKDQVKEISDSVKAGAVVVHVHPRNPQTCKSEMSPKLLMEVLDGVFATAGDCVTLVHSWHPGSDGEIDYISHNVNMVTATIPESVVGVYPGGRNWLPMLNIGILMGATIVRVGIEDCYWMYPHKDEIIKKNSDTVKVAVEMAQLLGRRVVTDPNEARRILGLELTSKL